MCQSYFGDPGAFLRLFLVATATFFAKIAKNNCFHELKIFQVLFGCFWAQNGEIRTVHFQGNEFDKKMFLKSNHCTLGGDCTCLI